MMGKVFGFIKKYSVWIFILYFLVLIFVLIFKFPSPIFWKLIEHWKSGKEIYIEPPHLVPFEIITYYVKSAHSFSDWFFKNLMCNIVMFMPCGFLVPLFVRRNKWWYVLLFGSLLSLVIELTQWAIGIGIFDIDDVILNSFGTMIGFGIYKLIYSVALKNSLD